MGSEFAPDLAVLQGIVYKLKSDLEGLTRTVADLQGKTNPPADVKPASSPDLPSDELAARFCNDEKVRSAFLKELKKLRKSPETIADNRYKNKYGPYWPNEPIKSSWRVREANRYITEINRQRELRPVQLSIILGTLAVAVALLAIPLKDSFFAWIVDLFGR
jgi:hypothetical protein